MASRRAPRVKASSPWPVRSWLTAFLIALAAGATYANSLSIPFVLDDVGTVVENADIRRLGDLRHVLWPSPNNATAGRPLVSLSFALNYAAGGLEPSGYHAINLVLHLCCALLLLGIVRQTLALPVWGHRWAGAADDLALAVALLWVVHPLTSEVVDYVTQRTESMAAVCILAALYAAVRGHVSSSPRWRLASIVACLLGVLSKETAVVIPAVVVLYDRAFLVPSWRAVWRQHRSLHVGLMASWLVVALLVWTGPRATVAGFAAGVDPWTYLLNQAVVIVDYLRLAVWPVGLAAFWGWPQELTLATVWPSFALVATLALASVAAFVLAPRVGFCALWFFVNLAPTSSLVPIVTEVGADRRMYLPLAGLAALVVCVPWYVLVVRPAAVSPTVVPARGRGCLLASALAVATLLAWTTAARNREYSSPLTLAQTIVDRRPSAVAHQILGEQLALAGHTDQAAVHLRRAVEQGDTRASYPLGLLTFTGGDIVGAAPHFERVVQSASVRHRFGWLEPPAPEVLSARAMLAQAYASQGRWADADTQARAVLARVPAQLDIRRVLVASLLGRKRWDEAIAESRQYLSARPDDGQAHVNLGIALVSAGRLEEGRAELRTALAVDPGNASARRLLDLATENTRPSGRGPGGPDPAR